MPDDNNHALRELATRAGIVDAYWDQTGNRLRETSDDTRRAFLDAMGIDTRDDDATHAALAHVRDGDGELLPAVRVVEVDALLRNIVSVRAPATRASSGPWRLELVMEDGTRHVSEGPWRGEAVLELSLPVQPPLGYHRLRLTFNAGADEWTNEQMLIVVPPRCTSPEELLGDRPAFGIIANLYTIKSPANWGVGDFSDLTELASWAGEIGADFVGVNPLHALLNRGGDVSPYSPVSRLFRNPIYIDVTRVPELEYTPEMRMRITSPELSAELEALRESPSVRYEQVMAVKGMALDALHRVFFEQIRGSGSKRDRAYQAYVAANEPALSRFATWMAIAEHHHAFDWRIWPEEFRRPDTDAVRAFAERCAHRIDFHRWVQFEADRQLGEAAKRARERGMRIGLYQDLAIGSSPAGADTWAFSDLFVRGVSVGAPPDPYSATGQNWGLPPIDPRALRKSAYEYFVSLIRAGFRHAGALRIDHVMGLFRLFWIPEGQSGENGAYVLYPFEDLLGIIALESVRHNALVVGEDLGTVPDEVPRMMHKWGILSSKVLYFERNWHGDGSFKPADAYPSLSLTTANTHDLPSIAGFWSERDIALRRDVGQIMTASDEERARTERDRDRVALVKLLAAEGILPEGYAPQSSTDLRAAVHAFLWSTPSVLVGLSLDDIAGEIDPVNVPGVGPDRYPSWTRKMRSDLATIISSGETDFILAHMRRS